MRRSERRIFVLVAGAALSLVLVTACTFVRPLDYLQEGALLNPDAEPGSSDARDDSPDRDAGLPEAFCASRRPVPFFCADFDENGLHTGFRDGTSIGLPAPNVTGGASVVVDHAAQSGGSAAAFSTPALIVGSADARFVKPFSLVQVTAVQLVFALRIATFSATTRADVATITLQPPGGGSSIRAFFTLRENGNASVSLEGSGVSTSQSAAMPEATSWVIVEFRVDVAPSLRARLVVDGTRMLDVANTVPFVTADSAAFTIGLSPSAPADAASIVIDDLVFEGL